MSMRELMRKLFHLLLFYMSYIFLIAFTCCFKHVLDFCNSNYREVFGEQEEASKEQAKRAHIEPNLPNGRAVIYRPA